MRGKARLSDVGKAFYRITPAYAGKRDLVHLRTDILEDHPCICGEKRTFQISLAPLLGSPLHMRGKVPPINIDIIKIRITPAYAGKRPIIAAPRVKL